MLPNKNYFTTFGLPQTYNIDKQLLKKQYYTLVKRHHPDLVSKSIDSNFHNASINEINMGFKILGDDYLRAKYLYPNVVNPGNDFLTSVLEIEEDISLVKTQQEYDKVYETIQKGIEKCKERHNDPIYVSKWAYYNRLMHMLKKKKYSI